MVTDWVRAGFFYTWTCLAGLDPWSEPSPFNKRVFYAGPRPPRWAPWARFSPTKFGPNLWPKSWPNQKKKKEKRKIKLKPKFIFA